MFRFLPFLMVFSVACEKDDTDDTDKPKDWDDYEWSDEIPAGEPTTVVNGNLTEGAIMEDLDWASDSAIACWPGTQDANFNGNHVMYQYDQGANRDFHVVLEPATSDLDLSLWGYQVGPDDDSLPDTLLSANCEASYDAQYNNNPGELEYIFLIGYTPHNVVIGVAGANNTTTGAYTLKIWDAEGAGFDTDSY